VADKVVDASAVVAFLFNEVTQQKVAARLRDASLHAPALLEFEVANACLKKMRASPREQRALLEAFSLLGALAITPEAVNLSEAIALGEQAKVSLYDASYLWLARALDAELVTLDDKLARADKTLRRARERR
jgi:predicted nucleic acid-binding protein